MLKMPALIREWKAVCSKSSSPFCGTRLTAKTGWKEKLDQVAEIKDHSAITSYQLLHSCVLKMYINMKIPTPNSAHYRLESLVCCSSVGLLRI